MRIRIAFMTVYVFDWSFISLAKNTTLGLSCDMASEKNSPW